MSDKAYDIEIVFEDGTTFSIIDGVIVNAADLSDVSEEVPPGRTSTGPFEFTITLDPPLFLNYYLFPPGGKFPGLHDN